MTRDDRAGGDDRRKAREAIAEAMLTRVDALAERWREKLETTLRLRPQNVFPGSTLLDGIPEVIHFLIGHIANGRSLGTEQRESLHALADYWRSSGYSLAEALLHLRILAGILHQELRAEIEVHGGALSAVEGASLAERLAAGLGEVESLLVGTYRDAEDDRFEEFGGTLAHEIRGQLATAMAAAEVLRIRDQDPSGEGAAQRAEAIDRITRAVESAGQLVQSVRTFSRARSGLGEWTMKPLPAVIGDVVDRVEQESRGVRVEPVDVVPDVRVPAEAVELVLHNLVENAVTYSDPAKTERWVRIQCRRYDDEEHWLLQVDDNGLGIPHDEQERIFARFLRGRHAEGAGFGLGLSIARQAALSIGGAVVLEQSEEGTGSTFSFTIPYAETDAPTPASTE